MTSTHYTRRRSTTAAIVVVLAVVFAPVLTPAALAYDAKAGGPDASARLILPDWDRLDDGIDPLDGTLIPRRAMEHPQEWDDIVIAIGAVVCVYWCAPALAASYAWGGLGYAVVSTLESTTIGMGGRTHHKPCPVDNVMTPSGVCN